MPNKKKAPVASYRLLVQKKNKKVKSPNRKQTTVNQKHSSPSLSPDILLLVAFGLFLLVLPTIMTYVVPCFRAIPGQSYAFAECNSVLALDRFVWFAIGGLSGLVTMLFASRKQHHRSVARVTTLSIICALGIIAAYYIYMPQAASAAELAPIRLDTLK